VFFARRQEETHWAPGFLASYVEGKDITIARATKIAFNAKERGNQAMVCLVPNVEAKE